MKKDFFNNKINRINTNSVKWDRMENLFGKKDLLPFWVADMDFAAPEEVVKEIAKRVDHGVFGYTTPTESTNESVRSWVQKRHEWNIEADWITYSPGIVFAISMAIQAYTQKGDSILIQPPVYTPFFEMVKVNERKLIESPLHLKGDRYSIDFSSFEKQLASGVKMFILCSPHNPIGRVWKRGELEKIAELCKKYDVLILSDEIHSDLVYKPSVHIPISSLNEDAENRTITCIAPSKTFNVPGLQASAIIIPNNELREKYQQQQHKQGFFTLNTFGTIGLEAAYTHGEIWLNELLAYLQENIDFTRSFIKKKLPSLKVINPEGTYLLWIDCRALNMSDEDLHNLLLTKGKIAVESGVKYGEAEGKGFIRLNIGCPREQLKEGLKKLKAALS
ncbi:MalY/PatB family protein [Priestia flexa]|uniref:MalY/PatB family protein n=1 Tax=Priestia flexa TaxID=86664 RepID=UPI0011A84FF4|nr:MalY/PatB family protein [Priestia flexa]